MGRGGFEHVCIIVHSFALVLMKGLHKFLSYYSKRTTMPKNKQVARQITEPCNYCGEDFSGARGRTMNERVSRICECCKKMRHLHLHCALNWYNYHLKKKKQKMTVAEFKNISRPYYGRQCCMENCFICDKHPCHAAGMFF